MKKLILHNAALTVEAAGAVRKKEVVKVHREREHNYSLAMVVKPAAAIQ